MKSTKGLLSLLVIASVAGLAGCSNDKGKTSTSTKGSEDAKKSETSKPTSTSTDDDDDEDGVDLVMSVYYDNAARKMKFVNTTTYSLPYTSPDGTVYQEGDFKPVWKQIQNDLNINITDASPEQDTSIKDYFAKTLTVQGFKVNNQLVNIAQGNSDQIIEEGTSKNDILDLKNYLDKMPNFKKFLNDNPAVKKIISSAEGKLFYAPYFDGYDDLERMLMVRQDWVEKLLDGDTLPTETGVTLSKNYTPFYTTDINSTVTVLTADETGTETITKKVTASKNIIKQMNDATTLNGATAVKLLRDYIDATYVKADGTKIYGNKRSKLFCGGQAVYDVDELIALFRCVKGCPQFLTGSADTNMVALFPRAQSSDRTTDLYRFLQFFGIRGTESRNQWMYVDNSGKLVDVRGTTQFRDGLKKLHEMYQDGLILEDFTTGKVANSTDFRGKLYDGDYTNTKAAGFATYDYNQTTTVYNDSCKDTNAVIASVLPAVADFDDGTTGNFIHYTESWRSVKPQGWFITADTAKDEKKLNKCLELFDYLYSEKGNRLMSYGPDEYLAKDANNNIEYINYQDKQVPKLSDTTKKQMKDKTGGNYTNFYRYYLGATFPVGYVKEQGMEYQTVSTKAIPSLDTLNNAIVKGVLQHVNHQTDNASHMQDIVPTTLPFNKSENSALSSEFTNLNKVFTSNKKEVMVISDIVIDGFGTKGDYDLSYNNYCDTVNTTLKLTQFTTYYNDAYTRYLAL